jgi:F0F1-type ATP synthase delta subunit
MYSELTLLARTEDERQILKEELETLWAALFKKEGGFEEVLVQSVRPQTSEAIKTLISEGRIEDKAKFFEGAIKELESLKILELTVAFEPKGASVERIWQWVRRNVGEGIILRFGVDRSIGAGAIVVFGGKFRNYSLKKLLDSYFESSKQSLNQILSK